MSRAKPKPLLADEQWAKIGPLLPKLEGGPKGGRPWAENRACFEGILWVLRTGARWQDLPERYPSPPTCWRRLRRWEEDGTWTRVWRAFLGELDAGGLLDWNEAFIDASFAPAKEGASRSGRPGRERGRSGWWWRTVREFQSASTSRARALASRLSPRRRSELYESLAGIAEDRGRSRSG